MIVKKIKSSRTKNKAASIRDLMDYIRQSETRNADEKVLYSNGRGFISDSPIAQREEMVALASEAVRSKNPVNHYVLSWREGEQPSQEQIEEAMDVFLQELGLQDHQAIYALHQDTDNLHVHIAVNRVHPDTLKCIEINKGFDIEAAHRAIAKIEHAQGWQSEKNARYVMLENGELGREHSDDDKPRQPDQRKRDMEHRTGEKSAERIAIEEAASLIKNAQLWEQLHDDLAQKGMRYEKTGSGATIFVGDIGVKASSVCRQASFSQLQKRLGAYQPPSLKPLNLSEAQPIKPMPGWSNYIAGRKSHYEKKNLEKTILDKRHDSEKLSLKLHYKKRQDELFQGNWKGKGEALNALRSILAREHICDKLSLQEKHRHEREQHRQQFRPYPDFEQWQHLKNKSDLAHQWRYRGSEPQRIIGETSEKAEKTQACDIRHYQAHLIGKHIHYTKKDDRGGAGGGVSFIDTGKRIDIYEWNSRESVLAALQLASQKFIAFTIEGNNEYKSLCIKLAVEHGFKINNPELQESIQKEKIKIHQEKIEFIKPEQLKAFERYNEAVNAQRYRVTSIKMREDGSKQTFILDKQGGVTRGFTPQEIAQRTPEMQRLQRRGENLYYTPLSDDKHHILIDDMNRDKLERLIKDGYQPAVVLQSSPENYQAILTVPKRGTAHDRDVGNRLAEYFNRGYGDPKLSGCIHPHRAPGYENRKPQHQRPDGSYPEVRLLKAERRECLKTLALSGDLDAACEQQTAAKASKMRYNALERPDSYLPLPKSSKHAVDAYMRHYEDVMKRHKGKAVDLSRVDAMIAVRLRVTGHDSASIEGAIRHCAPTIRPQSESRDWLDYARRTARYAHSAAGEQQAAQLAKYRLQWEKLEGREPERQQEAAKEKSHSHRKSRSRGHGISY